MIALVAGCLAFLVACEPRERSHAAADAIFVHNLAPRVRDTLIPQEVARIGRIDGPLEYVFSEIYAFAVGPSGNTYIYDSGEGVREYDTNGSYVRHLARKGEGPREVGHLRGLAASPDGRVATYDLENDRIALFSDVEPVRTFRRPEGMPVYREDNISFHHDGSLWLAINPRFPSEGGIPYPRPVHVRVADGNRLVDTIWTPTQGLELCPQISPRRFAVGFWEDKRDPFVPKGKWALGPNGTFVIGCPAEYRFEVIKYDGHRVVVSRDWEPLRIPNEARTFFLTLGGISDVPRERPAYARLIVPGDGRIWVWPNQPMVRSEVSEELRQETGVRYRWWVSPHGAFDVFSEDGEWLAVVRLPSEARYSGFPTDPNVLIRGDTLWAVAEDDFGVQSVVRYQLPGIGR